MGGIFSTQHANAEAVQAGSLNFGIGHDIDDAVLAATNQRIQMEGQLANLLTLSVACESLPNLDVLSLTDAMCVLYQQKGQQWVELGRTEIINDNLNPKFIKNFQVEYRFEERQKFKIKVYDVDDFSDNATLDKHDFVGELEFMLHEVVTARNQVFKKALVNAVNKKQGGNGTLVITADEYQGESSNELMDFEMRCQMQTQLYKEDYLFFILSRYIAPEQFVPVYKSEIKQLDSQLKSFKWDRVRILTMTLCKEETDRIIRVDMYKSQTNGNHKFLGGSELTLEKIKNSVTNYEIHQKQVKTGTISFASIKFDKRYSFLDYVFGGCEISLSIAIDFTLSNGDPSDPTSLHYFDPKKNEYLQAISSVGQILQYYDSDKSIPLLGFGAQVPPVTHRGSNCFAVNGDIFNPECDGLEGVIEAYKHAIKTVSFYGPTHFSQVIKLIVDSCESERVSQQNQKYSILLLITDGIINDMQKTIDEIVRGSSQPLSIIIVGVGEEDFSSMEILDADDEPLYSNTLKKQMDRDIVQFVPFRKFKDNPLLLAKETLAEVPNQLLSYFAKRGILPKAMGAEERKHLQQQLSRVNSNANGQGVPQSKGPPKFYVDMKEHLLEKCQDMGMDFMEVSEFLESRGIPENNVELVLDYLKNPGYANKLKSLKGSPMRKSAAQKMIYEFYEPPQVVSRQLADQRKRSTSPLKRTVQQRDPNDCKICFANKIDCVLVPCGHHCICEQCSKKIKGECPICRKKVSQIVKTYEA